MLFNPRENNFEYQDEETKVLMQKVIDFMEEKGLERIKSDWHQRRWNYDFVEFMKQNKVLSTLMTPAGYGEEGARWDSYRLSIFSQITAFYGITYWYTFQVSMLGLGPVWLGSNEAIKHKTAQLLKDGHVFAFGLSEKEHGADVYSSEMTLCPTQPGEYVARGHKYYIGNGNEAALVSIFGKRSDSDEYVFFGVNAKHPNYKLTQNVVAHQNYVSEFSLEDYPIRDEDIMATGSQAWDNMLNTVNFCKFNLGFGIWGNRSL